MVDNDKNKMLEKLYQCDELKSTGKLYFYAPGESDIEYEYEGKRYVRAKVLNDTLRKTLCKEYLWVEVKTIIWFVDIDAKIAISEKIIAGPLQYNKVAKESIDKTYIGNFLEHYLSKDIVANKNYSNSINEIKSHELELNEWINWSNENNIHPILHFFMINTEGKYINRNMDWLSISEQFCCINTLSQASNFLEQEIYNELYNLYSSVYIDVDDILNDRVDEEKIKNLSNLKKYLLISLLMLYSKENYIDMVNFIKDKLGNKFYKLYEKMCDLQYNNKSLVIK